MDQQTAKDPVCGMSVDPAASGHSLQHGATVYYFCCDGCRTKFGADPEKYLNPQPAVAQPGLDTAVHTCPMHPEIRQVGPGDCPKCGMALDPADPIAAAASTENPELIDMTRRMWIGGTFALPTLILAMSHLIPGNPVAKFIPGDMSAWIQFVLSTPVVLWAGAPFFQRFWSSVRTFNLNMFTLIGMGVGVAYVYSVAATLMPGVFPTAFQMADGSVPVYFEAAAVIVVLVAVGQVLELRARQQTGSAIRALLNLAPKTAQIVDDDGEREVTLDQVAVGDMLRIRPGESVPVDGSIVDGRTTIDESMLTGEALPVRKTIGNPLTGGTMNIDGSVTMRAERVGNETMLAKIVGMVAEAQRSRAPIQKTADTVAAYFVPIVVAVAVLTFVVWAIFGPEPRFAFGLLNAVAVLIIACPCALGLATPMSITVAMGRGASNGILIKDAESVEVLERVNTLVVDKTGTLTEGKPTVVTVVATEGYSEEQLIEVASAVEVGSEHPLAAAIVGKAKELGLAAAAAQDFTAIIGQGAQATVNGRHISLGNAAMMETAGVDISAITAQAVEYRRQAQTVVFIAIDGNVAGFIGIADPIKATTEEAIATLHNDDVEIIMLTGDSQETAEAVAKSLGIDQVRAGVSPSEKGEIVRTLVGDGRIVAMAGDGVNDAPALAVAHVGIAMGTGTDVAIESAGVTLVKGDLRAIARARRLSRRTMSNIRQNLTFAFLYNSLGVPLAAGVLFPFFGILLSPIFASVAMSLSSVSVIGNALRLRSAKI